jgi:drug/metabolite transporter (DMT)-like permease
MTDRAVLGTRAPLDSDQSARGVAVTVMATIALAANNVAIPLAYGHGTTPSAMLLVRYVVLIAGLFILLLLSRRQMRLPLGLYRHAIAAGCLSCLGSLGLITAYGLIPVSLALLILYIYPILTAILQSFIERRPVGLVQFACVLTAFTGLAITLGAGGGLVHGFNLMGVLAAFGGAICFAGFFLWSRYGLAGAEPGVTTLFTSLAGLGLSAVAGFVLDRTHLMPFQLPGAGDGIGWTAMLWVSVCFSLAYFCMTWGVQLVGASVATMLMNLETVFTIPLAALILGEVLDARRLIGAGLVLASVVASQVLAVKRPH